MKPVDCAGGAEKEEGDFRGRDDIWQGFNLRSSEERKVFWHTKSLIFFGVRRLILLGFPHSFRGYNWPFPLRRDAFCGRRREAKPEWKKLYASPFCPPCAEFGRQT